jgi:hypothetical protein
MRDIARYEPSGENVLGDAIILRVLGVFPFNIDSRMGVWKARGLAFEVTPGDGERVASTATAKDERGQPVAKIVTYGEAVGMDVSYHAFGAYEGAGVELSATRHKRNPEGLEVYVGSSDRTISVGETRLVARALGIRY